MHHEAIKTTYKAIQQSIDEGLITEAQGREAIRFPWAWVIITPTLRIREIPWNGLEIETEWVAE